MYERNRFIQEKAPSYVYKILEGGRLSGEEWGKIEVNRITVIYEREEKSRNQIHSVSFVRNKYSYEE